MQKKNSWWALFSPFCIVALILIPFLVRKVLRLTPAHGRNTSERVQWESMLSIMNGHTLFKWMPCMFRMRWRLGAFNYYENVRFLSFIPRFWVWNKLFYESASIFSYLIIFYMTRNWLVWSKIQIIDGARSRHIFKNIQIFWGKFSFRNCKIWFKYPSHKDQTDDFTQKKHQNKDEFLDRLHFKLA